MSSYKIMLNSLFPDSTKKNFEEAWINEMSKSI